MLSNPPFGGRSAVAVPENGKVRLVQQGPPSRSDFWAATADHSLNFVQHAHTLLRIGGRAAVVVPDNTLFAGGAGEVIRHSLLQECDLHTILRLPTGIFYASRINASVLFFEKKGPQARRPCTNHLWVYDSRTGRQFTPRARKLRRRDLDDFVSAYRPGQTRESRVESERFRRFNVQELLGRPGVNLDIV